MVLQANFAKRIDAENTPPSTYVKGLAGRLHSSIQDTSRRRRLRTSGGSHTSKYVIEQAKRRSTNKSKAAASVRFTVTAVPTLPPDVEMDDATRPSTSQISAPRSIPISFPRMLGRPEFRDVSPEALAVIDPSLVDTNMNHIRETLEELGSDLLRSLASVKTNPVKDKLPKELEIVINDMAAIPPTHMLAVFGKQLASKPQQPRKVTLYPVHSLVFASHCASLPKFPTGLPVAFPEGEEARKVDVPVWPLCVPSPVTFPHLSTYLYNKRTDLFMRSLLPRPPPPSFEQDPLKVRAFARELAETFTVQLLVKHALMVFGVWQNVCALGVFDDNLWEALDTLWELLLNSIAIGTGNLSTLYPPPSTQEQIPAPA